MTASAMAMAYLLYKRGYYCHGEAATLSYLCALTATRELIMRHSCTVHLFFYKHNNYKHIEAEISEKSKHIVSIF